MGPNVPTVSHVKVYLQKSPFLCPLKSPLKFNSSFTLLDTDSGADLVSDLKPDGYIVLCGTFHIAQTRTRIPTPYFCIGQESEFQSIPESVAGIVNES